jgi:hypothetical protein
MSLRKEVVVKGGVAPKGIDQIDFALHTSHWAEMVPAIAVAFSDWRWWVAEGWSSGIG